MGTKVNDPYILDSSANSIAGANSDQYDAANITCVNANKHKSSIATGW